MKAGICFIHLQEMLNFAKNSFIKSTYKSIMIILNIETSTNVCSIALSENGTCIFTKSNAEGMNHAAMLSLFIADALEVLKIAEKKLDAVAISSGPGSYTGLRIGVSTAKGLSYGYGIPMIAVSTLEVMTAQATKTNEYAKNALFCPMIDARRMEVYSAFFNSEGKLIREISADVIALNSYKELLTDHPVYFFGNGAEKCKTTITHSNAHFIDDVTPLAENMISFAEQAFSKKKFVDVAYFEPFYLKEFQTTVPKRTS
jgi:tRNA threonylcarbamoyladenosine biosynthesis protein TsaB